MAFVFPVPSPLHAEKVDLLIYNLQRHVGACVYTYAQPAYYIIIQYMEQVLTDLRPLLITLYPIVGQIILLALGIALIPVLGPFGPLVVELVGQTIMFVIHMIMNT